jgi:thioredoxin reductase (NADPH)
VAICLARYNRSVLVVDDNSGRSTAHEVNENYLGFPEGIPAKELRDLGRRQAERFGPGFVRAHVSEVKQAEGVFRVAGEGHEFLGRTLITSGWWSLAKGTRRR